MRALLDEAAEMQACTASGSGLQAFGQWLIGHYAQAARSAATEAGEEGLPLEMLGRLTRDLAILMRWSQGEQRLGQDAARVALEERMVTLAETKTEEAMEQQFEEWLERPEVKARFERRDGLSDYERGQRVRAILGL
ncbi:MAG: hypothetical protein P4L99_27030 [Chthoniobacter sp.]|nr:hypothetical protein [Chthoniobacter sp.]